jgi:hypothetical protein
MLQDNDDNYYFSFDKGFIGHNKPKYNTPSLLKRIQLLEKQVVMYKYQIKQLNEQLEHSKTLASILPYRVSRPTTLIADNIFIMNDGIHVVNSYTSRPVIEEINDFNLPESIDYPIVEDIDNVDSVVEKKEPLKNVEVEKNVEVVKDSDKSVLNNKDVQIEELILKNEQLVKDNIQLKEQNNQLIKKRIEVPIKSSSTSSSQQFSVPKRKYVKKNPPPPPPEKVKFDINNFLRYPIKGIGGKKKDFLLKWINDIKDFNFLYKVKSFGDKIISKLKEYFYI